MNRFEAQYQHFHQPAYLEINRARFIHLEKMGISFTNKSILELGAGIGDHTEHLLSSNPTRILSVEARRDNWGAHDARFRTNSRVESLQCDVAELKLLEESFNICYCYGLLYHLDDPVTAIKLISNHTEELLLLETCVSASSPDEINIVKEDSNLDSQAFGGVGCRPGRAWLFRELKKHFNYVYLPDFQPEHDQFPLNWTKEEDSKILTRAIFLASRTEINNERFISDLPMIQSRL